MGRLDEQFAGGCVAPLDFVAAREDEFAAIGGEARTGIDRGDAPERIPGSGLHQGQHAARIDQQGFAVGPPGELEDFIKGVVV